MAPRTRWKYRAFVARAARSAERVICPSEFTALDVSARYGVSRERIRVVPEAPALSPGTAEPPRRSVPAGCRRPAPEEEPRGARRRVPRVAARWRRAPARARRRRPRRRRGAARAGRPRAARADRLRRRRAARRAASAAPTRSSSRACTRGSGSSCSTRWPAGAPCSSPAPARCPRPGATRPRTSTRSIRATSLGLCARCSATPRSAHGCARRDRPGRGHSAGSGPRLRRLPCTRSCCDAHGVRDPLHRRGGAAGAGAGGGGRRRVRRRARDRQRLERRHRRRRVEPRGAAAVHGEPRALHARR